MPNADSAAANASSVGANTVNGPGPLKVSTNPAACTAATKVGKAPDPTATSTTVPGTAGSSAGSSTGSGCEVAGASASSSLPHAAAKSDSASKAASSESSFLDMMILRF